jgi:ribosomal protein S18 acetylase RimI-like enzyme
MPIIIHDKTQLESYFRQTPFLHIYEIGDLDDFFWPHTIWFGQENDGELEAVSLLYTPFNPPIALFLAAPESHPAMRELINDSAHLLPESIYVHISDGLQDTLAQHFSLQSHGLHFIMALSETTALLDFDTTITEPLTSQDEAEISALFNTNHPENAFDPRMLETGQFFGIRQKGQLVSVGGIHAYSAHYRVAAVGNVLTAPHARGQGFGSQVTARVCQSLLESTDHIGLNVKYDNVAAIHTYKKLGFEIIASYEEISAIRK